MFAILQVKQSPQLFVATQNNMSAATAVTTIRTALCSLRCTHEVNRTASAFTGATTDFYVINEIGFHRAKIQF
jgi:hypothetical protein